MLRTMLWAAVILVVCVRGCFNAAPGPAAGVQVRADLDRAAREVDPRFLSVAVDASLVAEEKFMYMLGSPKLRTLARALTPSYLRFGGTQQDFMVFNMEKVFTQSHGYDDPQKPEDSCEKMELPPLLEERLKKQWTQQQVLLRKEDLQRKYRRVKFTEYSVDLLNSFANCTEMDLIFGLNALLRTSDNTWNSSNARSLIRYCESKQYRISWELGNEPNSYEKKAGIRVDGSQLGEDFVQLREILRKSKLYHDTGLYGPDISQPRDHRKDLLQGFLSTGSEAIDACTWHHYYVDGRTATLAEFISPEVLDSLGAKISEVLESIRLVSPGMKTWLGESSTAYGGGADGLSNAFVAGFMWLDKLGLSAKMGLDIVIRQVLIGSGTYHLVDDNLDPLPDYWLSVLHKRVVGPVVLTVDILPAPDHQNQTKKVRVYLHCANRNGGYSKGAVTLIAMNLGARPSRLSLPAELSLSTVEAFVLQSDQPGEEGLYSRSVMLNGKLLQMLDDRTLPELKGHIVPPADHLILPGFSLAFYVFTEAQAAACL
ncbi:Heparanase [Merluccius polli]|uniref:Heparanase n=1 Tax=Merluccius polli TaxID=89951 RepID=A0AA47MJQ3_MERPO|nr:Heparanase [Merluccius polli]